MLFLLGIYCIVVKKNLIKIVIGLFLLECAVNLLIVSAGYRAGAHAPIIEKYASWSYLNPIPQEMAVISILIGLSSLALAVAVVIRLYDRYGTFDIREIRKLKG